ncbi:MAG: exodeoxyribonuclease VII large subunit [Bdellovibrionales bacterium]
MSDRQDLFSYAASADVSPDAASKAETESSEPHVYSISELNRLVKNTIESEFPLIWIRGEISNFKPHSSGHFYFSLKDATSQISAVMFKGHNSRLKFRPEDGMEVMIRGRLTVYEPRGSYQVFCELMEPVGAGALQKAFEQLKKKLESEGLFDVKKKRPLPAFPKRVALVTSPTGAAIRDMLNVLTRRCKNLDITLIATAVQGEAAPMEIVKAIELANSVLPAYDVMIVGRGGGSIEDLWAFNTEPVARAIHASKIPTVSAVGHEIDFTIADFVADLRAPTPSAAAELVVKNMSDVLDQLKVFQQRLQHLCLSSIQRRLERLQLTSRRLIDPKRKLQDMAIRCDELIDRLKNQWRYILERKQSQLGRSMSLLDSLSPLKVIDRGYAIVSLQGKIVKSHKETKANDSLTIRLSDGEVTATVSNSVAKKETP